MASGSTPSSVPGSTLSMSESRAQALQALLTSLSPAAKTQDVSGDRLSSDHVKRISDKLGEMLGEDASPAELTHMRNEKGELLNEEGLPVIDIVEPIPPDGNTPAKLVATPSHDPDVLPLWALSPLEKARRRAERERILDALEEEERIEQDKEEARDREQRLAELETRKEAAKAEMEALKKAREMQKKMGKALLQNIALAREREEAETRAREEAETAEREERRKLKPKKSVTFAEPPKDDEKPPEVPPRPVDRNDANLKSTILSKAPKAQADSHPMRMNVVERTPKVFKTPKSPPPPGRDSDDESDYGTTEPEEAQILYIARPNAEGFTPPPPHDDSDQSDFGLPEEEPVEWDEEGYDFARHQREVALAYYQKRSVIGSETLDAMTDHTHDEDRHEWDQPMVPLEATLASAPPKPPVSVFKAARMGIPVSPPSGPPSRSLGSSILPSSQTSALKSAVRVGKLEDGKLVGGADGESDDDLAPEAKDVLDMLQRGDVVNVGPTLPADVASSTSFASSPSVPSPSSATVPQPSDAVGEDSKPKLPKLSKFKMAMAESPSSALSSGLTTPLNTVERSSPKVTPGTNTPIAVPTPTSSSSDVPPAISQRVADKRPLVMPSMIVESPDFPGPRETFGPYPSPMTASSGGSPAFSPTSTAVGTPTTSFPSSVATTPLTASPAAVMSLEVKERSGGRLVGATGTKEKKVSRFAAGRT